MKLVFGGQNEFPETPWLPLMGELSAKLTERALSALRAPLP